MAKSRFFKLCAASVLAFASALLAGGAARAETMLPDGTTIPRQPSGTNETMLFKLFADRSESIDWIKDGFPTPNTFSPLCNFKATFVLKQSGSNLGVGWYNVVPNATTRPTQAEIYQIIAPGTSVGTVIQGSDIRTSPNYKGGLIGFALKREPPHFTEAKWNTLCTGCKTPGNWILSVSYRSKNLPNAYYVAFEDGSTSATGWDNDGDYNDYVFLFEGLACAGDGQACQVPNQKGVCVDGITECNNTGALECRQLNPAKDETCDNLDNDCDGETDEGEGLCAIGEQCIRGQCMPACGTGEFACFLPPFTECVDGVCVDPKCKGKTCETGQVCVEGECRAPCDGVTCPTGRVCRQGACVDPCASVKCSEQSVCVAGACVLACSCSGCAAGEMCGATDGRCIDNDCVNKTCGVGQYCTPEGTCADACANAKCPAGSVCDKGECIVAPMEPNPGSTGSTGGGSSTGSSTIKPGTAVDLDGDGKPDGVAVDTNGDGVSDGVDTNGDGSVDAPLPTGSQAGTGGPSEDAGTRAGADGVTVVDNDNGCAISRVKTRNEGAWLLSLLAIGLSLVGRRRLRG